MLNIAEIKELGYKKIFFAMLLLFLACFIVYSTSLGNGFLMDDHNSIVTNILIKSFRFIPQMFSHPFLGSYYRPVTCLSFSLDHFIWKLNPFGYHLTNIFLHFLNSFFFFILLYLIFKEFSISLISSMLFAIHPLNSITVNFISDRGNLLAGLFMLGALIAFCLGYKSRRMQLYLPGFLLFMFALLSRENAVLFPFYLLCILLTIYNKPNIKHIAILTTLTLFISLGYLLLRMKYFSLAFAICPDPRLLFSPKTINAFSYLIFKYFTLTILPYNILLVRQIGQNASFAYGGVISTLFVTLCISLLLLKLRRNKIILFGSGWFLIGLLPLYNLMFFRLPMGLMMQDNWIYFSSFGLFIILSAVFLYLKRQINQKLWIIFIAFVFLFYANRSIANSTLWKDQKSYCLYWLNLTSQNYIATSGLADYYARNKDYAQAKYYLEKTLDYSALKQVGNLGSVIFDRKWFGNALTSLGCIAEAQGNLDQAMQYFVQASEVNPRDPNPYHRIALLYLLKNNITESIRYSKETIKRQGNYLDAHYQLAIAYALTGDLERAFAETKIALSLDPNCFNGLQEKIKAVNKMKLLRLKPEVSEAEYLSGQLLSAP